MKYKSWLLVLCLTLSCWAGTYVHCSIKDLVTGKVTAKYIKTSGVVAARSEDEFQWWLSVCQDMSKKYCVSIHLDKHIPVVVPNIGERVDLTLVRDDQ